MKYTIPTLLGVASAAAQLTFTDPIVTGNVSDSQLDEISGMFAARNATNEGKLITCHDSDPDFMFVLNSDGSLHSKISLANDRWTDAEEVTGYTAADGTNFVILCEFGDNPAGRDVKNLYRFVEPSLNGLNIDVTNYDKISYRLPADVLLEKGTNRGDFEGAFVSVADGKIYLFSKRMPVNYIFSLPIQDTYEGVLTATFEGTMNAYVAEETGGIISPSNCVAAALTSDEKYAVVKTYNTTFLFENLDGRDWVDVLVNDQPTIVESYVGLGAAPAQEPQGESIAFRADDNGFFTVSEYRGNSQVPLFYYDTEITVVQPDPVLIGIRVDGDQVQITVDNLPQEFFIEWSTNLKKWTLLTEDVSVTTFGVRSTITFTHTPDTNKSVYYQIGYTAPPTDGGGGSGGGGKGRKK